MHLLILFPLDNNNFSIYFVSLVFGYILGSIPFGYIVGRIRGIDIRNRGSNNIGFTNVNRILGFVYAIPVLILDIAKGFLPTFFANHMGFIPAIVGLGTVLGHIFTSWLSFKGGKGVATSIGVFLALTPIALACSIGVFILVLSIFSFVSLASLSFVVSLPVFSFFIYSEQKIFFLLALFVAIIVIIRHKDNIRRLIQRTEPKISFVRLQKKQV
jgi:glycerol-3-phosphate acyltransferase PlsY